MGYKYPGNTKDITMPLITHYYLLKASRKLHRSYHAKP